MATLTVIDSHQFLQTWRPLRLCARQFFSTSVWSVLRARLRQRTDQPWAEPRSQRIINRRFSRIFTDEDSDISPQRRRVRREKPEIRHRRSEIGRENGYFVCRERATNKNVSPSRTITGYLTADFRGFSQMGISDDRLRRLRDRVFCLSGDDDKQKGSPRGVDARTPQGKLFCPIAVSRLGKNSSLCDLCASAVSKSFSAFIGVNLRLVCLLQTWRALHLCASKPKFRGISHEHSV